MLSAARSTCVYMMCCSTSIALGSVGLDGLRLIGEVTVSASLLQQLLLLLCHEEAVDALAVRRDSRPALILMLRERQPLGLVVDFEAHLSHLVLASGPLLSLDKNAICLLVEHGDRLLTVESRNDDFKRRWLEEGLVEWERERFWENGGGLVGEEW